MHALEGARRLTAGENLDSLVDALGVSPQTLLRRAAAIRRRALFKVPGLRRVSAAEITACRFRIAQLLLGALTEERFDREKEELVAGRLVVEDHRLGRGDTDYRVLNGNQKPIFRINIKFHGSAFDQARDRVELDPNDCFPLATYKIHQALVRQQAEALPYVFLVLSSLGLTARTVSGFIPEDLAWLVGVAGSSGKRDLEEAAVASLVRADPAPDFVASTRARLAAAEFRVISATRAEALLKEKLFTRVFALRQRAFTAAYKNAEIDMHFSLSTEMTSIRDFLSRVAAESHQRLTVLLDRGQIA